MDIIYLIKSAIIGVVEGITEFLPISSTGHMIIVQDLIGFNNENDEYTNMYTYIIQLGAILAVIVLYWEKIYSTIVTLIPKKGDFKSSGLNFWLVIASACIPGFFVQILLSDIVDLYLFNSVSVAITLIVGGIFMLYSEKKLKKPVPTTTTLDISYKQAFIIGSFQCLAVIPGMSRSASTIIGGWVAGLSTVIAAEFSFFLAIPVMVGMSFLKIISTDAFATMNQTEVAALIIGFVVSFVVALIVVSKFIGYLKKKPMKIFALYRIVFGILFLLFFL